MVDQVTSPILKMPLPNKDNFLSFDIGRLIECLDILDKSSLLSSDGTAVQDGKIALIASSSFNPANEAAMLALKAKPGDTAKIGSTTYLLVRSPASTRANWMVNDGTVQMNRFAANTVAELKNQTGARLGDICLVNGKDQYMLTLSPPTTESNWLKLTQEALGINIFTSTDLAGVISQTGATSANLGDMAKTTVGGTWILTAKPGNVAANWIRLALYDEAVKLNNPSAWQDILTNMGLMISSVDKNSRLRITTSGAKQSLRAGIGENFADVIIEMDAANKSIVLAAGPNMQYKITIDGNGILCNTDLKVTVP